MRWEYKSVQIETKGIWGGKVEGSELDRLMNELGELGWELVSAFDTNESLWTFKKHRLIVQAS